MLKTIQYLIIYFFIFSSTLFGLWELTIDKDEMNGEKRVYISSPTVQSTKPMPFPYSGIEAWLGIGSDGVKEWVYIGFTRSPNLIDTEIKDGYNLFTTRIKWDEYLTTQTYKQEWNSKFIFFANKDYVISKIQSTKTVLVELKWFGMDSVYFKFDLTGAVDQIIKMRNNFTIIQ